jgi:LacI family transcriptional regulator
MGKPTVHDIARAAGVSLATVDRVLNERPGVREVTVARVRAAIRELGYIRDVTAANLARQRQYRFAFFLPEGPGQFHATLREAVAEAARSGVIDRTAVLTRLVSESDVHGIARDLAALDPGSIDGVAIMAPETPQLRDAIAHLRAQGVPVVAFVSDLPNSGCDHFVGINNVAAGRTAGVLVGRFTCRRPGQVVVVTNTLQSRDSLDRRLGFDAVMAESFPEIEVLPTLETHGDPEKLAAMLRRVLGRWPGITGVYSIATGTQALVQAVEGIRTGLTLVVHELTPFARAALVGRRIDAVITQDVGHLVRSALRILRARCDGMPTVAAQERIRIEVVLRENLP